MFKQLMERARHLWNLGYNICVRVYLHNGTIEVMAGERVMFFEERGRDAAASLAKNADAAFAHLGACMLFLDANPKIAEVRAGEWIVPASKGE